MSNRAEVLADIQKRGFRKLYGQLIKSVLFCAVTIPCWIWFVLQNDLLTGQPQRVTFWTVIAVLVLFPFVRYKFYRLIFQGSFRGEVTELKGGRLTDHKDAEGGKWTAMHGDRVENVNVCTVTVRSNRGFYHQYTFIGNTISALAFEYYQVGDSVFQPLFAKYPYNETREPIRPFCLACGKIEEENSDVCSNCGAKLV